MKHLLLVTVGLFVATTKLSAQTLLYAHTFDGISINSWVMNETQTGMNYWTQNATYQGNASASVPDVPQQPMTFEGAPTSNYLHITSIPNCNGFVPVSCNANYSPGDSSSNYAEMLNGIPTLGEANVTFSFWYLCGGEQGQAYGQVEYTVNNGATWNAVGPQLYNTPNWTLMNITNPAFDNQSNIKFRFRWLNTTAATGGDPALAVDEITITGEHPGGNSIVVSNPSTGDFCAEETMTVVFDAPGPFNAGNVFIAELSSPSGSFASPVAIGTLTSSGGSSLTINATLPANANGTAYRIRVTASDPASTGTDNGGDLAIHPLPTINVTTIPVDGVICEGESITMTASGAATYSWTPTVSNPTDPSVTASPLVSTIYTVTGTTLEGCSADGFVQVGVEDCADLQDADKTVFQLFPNPASANVQLIYTEESAVQSVEVRDMNGRIVFTSTEAVESIDVRPFTAGVYLLRVATSEGISTQQFVRQ